MLLLPLLALFGAAVDERRIELDLGTRPARWDAIVVCVRRSLVGLTASWVGGTAFEASLRAVVFPLFVLVIAFGLTVFADRGSASACSSFVVALGLLGGVRNVVDQRTQAARSPTIIRAEAKPGDFVVYCPDQLGPDVSRLLGGGPRLVEVTFPDGAPPERVDWVDYIERVDATDARAFARRVAKRAGPDRTIWLVAAPGYHNVEGKCEALTAELNGVRGRSLGRVDPDDKYFEFQGLIQFPPVD